MQITYPACFYPDQERIGAYAVVIPDLPGCATGGNTLAEAYEMAVDAASGWVLDELEEGRPIPASSYIKDIKPGEGGFVSIILLDMTEYAEKYGNKSVRKNLTIPAWMDTYAKKHNINFSKLLQETIFSMAKAEN